MYDVDNTSDILFYIRIWYILIEVAYAVVRLMFVYNVCINIGKEIVWHS